MVQDIDDHSECEAVKTARLDYVSMAWEKAIPLSPLSGKHPTATYVKNITNRTTFMLTVRPTWSSSSPSSGALLKQAQRLRSSMRVTHGMRVNIVAADQLYNEFSSGTPDANAYRSAIFRNRCRTELRQRPEMPRYLLLFGGLRLGQPHARQPTASGLIGRPLPSVL